jgi:hypothetical protein
MTAVQLTNGEVIEAKNFVSNILPQLLFQKLIPLFYVVRIVRELGNLQNTISNFYGLNKFKENTTPYLNYIYFYYKNADVWAG